MIQKLSLIACILSCVSILQAACTDEVVQYGGHYYSITNTRMTFNEAKQAAENSNGYLAIPNSEAENNFIKNLIGGNRTAWIGIHDPNKMTNYCYPGTECAYDASRFRDINNNVLSYANWNSYEPNNYVYIEDVQNGTPMVSPLGEHWVAMFGNSGKWADTGNHMQVSPKIMHFAVFEFDTKPDCYFEDGSNIYEFEEVFCNTAIYDTQTQGLIQGVTHECQEDQFGTYYCPEQLAECSDHWEYDDGSSLIGYGSYTDYTNRTFTCPANGYLLSRSDHDACSYCYDLMRHDVHCNLDGSLNVHVYTIYKSNGALAYDIFNKRIASTQIHLNQASTYLGNYGNGCNFPFYYRRTCNASAGQCTHYISLSGSTCNGRDYTTSSTNPIPAVCTNGYTATSGAEAVNGECKKTVNYTYYDYICSNDLNEYGNEYIISDTGGDCGGTGLEGGSCNSATPPEDNCKRLNYMCQEAPDRKCASVDGSMQCSPFPCINSDAIQDNTAAFNANQQNNDGWNENGGCDGQIYIFAGDGARCISWELGGITDCCGDSDRLLGLSSCKSSEKMLAEKRESKMCHYVGEFCSKEVELGFDDVCVQESEAHCCYNSMLARIINVGAKAQLGLTFGTPESPDCRGFTPEEFQRIDLSQIDLSEFIRDIRNDANVVAGSNTANRVDSDQVIQEQLHENINNATINMGNNIGTRLDNHFEGL